VLTDDDTRLIIEALFDIRTELREIRAILEADDDAEGSEEEEP
jgi:hypothetical protein